MTTEASLFATLLVALVILGIIICIMCFKIYQLEERIDFICFKESQRKIKKE